MKIQKIGIWGLGAVGRSALNFFQNKNTSIEVMDIKEPEPAAHSSHVLYTRQGNYETIEAFFERNEMVIVSPGIDMSPYARYAYKCVSELDLLWQSTQTPILGITGTVGKTTVTTLLSRFLENTGSKIATGGNIGTPMLDLIKNNDLYDYLILELSSFQLELNRECAPKLAIWTNFYANHLDRHHTIADYFAAKSKIFAHQTPNDSTLLPNSLIPLLREFGYLDKIPSKISFFSIERPMQQEKFTSPVQYFYLKNNVVMKEFEGNVQPLINLHDIGIKTYPENILICIAALDCLQQPLDSICKSTEAIQFEHRLEYVATVNNIAFYNDSKATIMQATQAAVQALSGNNIILLLGGVSKGVDRRNEIQKLSGKVKQSICFGSEAPSLSEACNVAQISTISAKTLEEAFNQVAEQAEAGDVVLFSPGGASFDLFENYKKRGERFKELVHNYMHR